MDAERTAIKTCKFKVSFRTARFARVISFSRAKGGEKHILKREIITFFFFFNFSKAGKNCFQILITIKYHPWNHLISSTYQKSRVT